MHFSIVKLMLIKMKSSFSFIFFVFSVSCIAFASGGAQDFHQYFLVQTWPPVYCQVHRPEPCRIKPSKFVLHGLWPVNSSGRSSTNTNNQTINLQDMLESNKSFAAEMNKFWPSLTRDENENEQFWEREWKHHGRGQPTLPPEEYFRTAITLVKAANLEAAFRGAGINPDGDKLNPRKYTRAINTRYGTTPLYKCLNTSLLMEVTLCVDAKARNFVPCIAQRSSLSNCVGDIIWAL
uniref:Ribonuclease T2 n=1 Tax=Citrus tamurana TaxID=488172 RepID=A0A7U3LRE8_9ROSI|nr:ribonuclease T2 [Citrus tamurana]